MINQSDNYLEVFNCLDSFIPNKTTDYFSAVDSLLDLIPASIYCKDLDGYYLARNQFAASKMAGQSFEFSVNKSDVIGKTDYDLFDKKTADQFRKHDRELNSSKLDSMQFIECLMLPTGELINQISMKKIAQTSNRKKCIIGCTINISNLIQINKPSADEFMRKFLQFMVVPTSKLLSDIVVDLQHYIINNHLFFAIKDLLFLSERELQCLCLLTRGSSSKQIGRFLNISYRTVEVFIDRIKKKLKMSSKSQLIEWFWHTLSKL